MNVPVFLSASAQACRCEGRFLGADDLPELIALRRSVLKTMQDPDLYVVEDDEEAYLSSLCGPKGRTYGIFDRGMMVAYGSIGLPEPDDEDNLGWELGWERDKRRLIAHIESCMVLPSYRGYAFQRFLLQLRFAIALSAMRRYAVAMVSLKNHQSRHNMLVEGMHLKGLGEFSHGRRRQLMVADLLHAHSSPPPEPRLVLDADDYEGQKKAVQAGLEGYWDERREGRQLIAFN